MIACKLITLFLYSYMLLFKHACVFFSRFLLQSISKPKEGPPENLEEVPRIWEGEGYWRSEILNPVDIMTTFRGTPPIGPRAPPSCRPRSAHTAPLPRAAAAAPRGNSRLHAARPWVEARDQSTAIHQDTPIRPLEELLR